MSKAKGTPEPQILSSKLLVSSTKLNRYLHLLSLSKEMLSEE